MAPRSSLLPLRISGLAFWLCAGALLSSLAITARAEAPATSGASSLAVALSAELTGLADAASAEEWLADAIPVGTALADEPDFFADASEVFYDADEGLVVFVYRSATRGRWVAWVSFDSERVGVVHTAAIDL